MTGIKGKSGAPGKPRKEGGGRKRSRIIIHKANALMIQRMANDGDPLGEPFTGKVAVISGGKRNDTFIIVGTDETWTLTIMPPKKKPRNEPAH
jgi:hypothetical protein